MSEPIESISQGNYILHNIDAKKLYVQEPLFTANSGDAVYVGWRPDETVLYESSEVPNRISTFTVSERLTNFEYIRVIGYGYPNAGTQPVIIDFPAPANYTDNISMSTTYYCYHNDNNPLQIMGERFSTSDGLTYDIIDKKMLYWTPTGATPTSTNTNYLGIKKIVGINRKENA